MERGLLKKFEAAFSEWYRPLCLYALNYTGSYEDSEDIVQQLFADIWEKIGQEEWSVSNLKAYLFTAVRNRSLNYNQKEKRNLSFDPGQHDQSENNQEEDILHVQREAKLWDLIDTLPSERRRIFLMAKQKGMKYQEIAEELHLSVKTVENQIGRALKSLRDKAIRLYLFFFG